MTTLPNPWVFSSAETSAGAAAVTELLPPGAAAANYSPEPFSEYAARRSMPIVSPPIETPKEQPGEWPRGFDPERFVGELEQPPLFLRGPRPSLFLREPQPPLSRKPSASFLQALFDLAGPER